MGDNKEDTKEGDKETDPALPKAEEKPKGGDQIANVIGEVGRWQLEKILIVFLASAPGIYIALLNQHVIVLIQVLLIFSTPVS